MKKTIDMHWDAMMDAKCMGYEEERKRVDLLLEAKFDVTEAIDNTLITFRVAYTDNCFGEQWTKLTPEFLEWYYQQPRIVYDGFHKVEKFTTTIKNEEKSVEKLHIKSAVSGLVIDKEGKVALVRQFRPCVGKFLYELPAGLKDKNLSSDKILIEELDEECAITLNELKCSSPSLVASYYMVCGSSDASMDFYRVELDTVHHTEKVNDVDVEEVVWVTPKEFDDLYGMGDIQDAKTLIAYFYYKYYTMYQRFEKIKKDMES